MQQSQVMAAIAATPKGANVVLEWVRPLKTRKGVQDSLTKSVRMIGRVGVEYDNLSAVQIKRDDGSLPAENQGLSWGEWVEYPYVIGHKGQLYLRLYKGTSDKVHPECHFFRNGIEVSKESLNAEILASEKEEKTGDCFTCKFENITRIHAESEWVTIVVGQVGQEKVATAVPVPASALATML